MSNLKKLEQLQIEKRAAFKAAAVIGKSFENACRDGILSGKVTVQEVADLFNSDPGSLQLDDWAIRQWLKIADDVG